jgi:hypothetical protein
MLSMLSSSGRCAAHADAMGYTSNSDPRETPQEALRDRAVSGPRKQLAAVMENRCPTAIETASGNEVGWRQALHQGVSR